jgi:2-isopropylmalate synthase
VTSAEIWTAFRGEYLDRQEPFAHRDHRDDSTEDSDRLTATISESGVSHTITGVGKGPIEAFINGFQGEFGIGVRIVDYEEHAVGRGADATAVCFVEAKVGEGLPVFGVGMHRNIVTASLNAIISAVNRAVDRDGAPTGSRGAENTVPVA